ncbi:MAG TPA: NDP-hexose 4-ketoreductase, partial [Chloroflexi bacterium]|nr:NDP-hexose 4-ketoreductase [Chloroflexota bacterium]
IEKAHPEAHNLLLQIMEEGHLSDSKGKKVDFRNALIIMTSNIGAELIRKQTDFGFQAVTEPQTKEDQSFKDMQKNLTEALHEVFRPEFINRVDETIVFRSLTKKEITEIVDLELDKVQLRLDQMNLNLQITEDAKSFLAQEGYDPEYGARPLKRTIQQHIEDKLSDIILSSPNHKNNIVTVDVDHTNNETIVNMQTLTHEDTE